jgi:hypothetical protein
LWFYFTEPFVKIGVEYVQVVSKVMAIIDHFTDPCAILKGNQCKPLHQSEDEVIRDNE